MIKLVNKGAKLKEIYKEFCWYNDGNYIVLDINPNISTTKELIACASSYLKRIGFNKQDITEELTHCYIISYSKNIIEMYRNKK